MDFACPDNHFPNQQTDQPLTRSRAKHTHNNNMSGDEEIDMSAIESLAADTKPIKSAPKRKRLSKLKKKKRESLVDSEAEEVDEEEAEREDVAIDDCDDEEEDAPEAKRKTKKRRVITEDDEEEEQDQQQQGGDGDDEDADEEPNEEDLAFIDDSGDVQPQEEEHAALLQQRIQLEDQRRESSLKSRLLQSQSQKEQTLASSLQKSAESQKAKIRFNSSVSATAAATTDTAAVFVAAATATTTATAPKATTAVTRVATTTAKGVLCQLPISSLPPSTQNKPKRMSGNKEGDHITLGFRVMIGDKVWRCTHVGRPVSFERAVNAKELKLTPSVLYTFYNETEPITAIDGKDAHNFEVFFVSTILSCSPIRVSKTNMDHLNRNILALADKGDGVDNYKTWCKKMITSDNLMATPHEGGWNEYQMFATHAMFIQTRSAYKHAKKTTEVAEPNPNPKAVVAEYANPVAAAAASPPASASSRRAAPKTEIASGVALSEPCPPHPSMPAYMADESVVDAIFTPVIDDMVERFKPHVLHNMFSSIHTRMSECVQRAKGGRSKTAALDEAVKMMGKQFGDVCAMLVLLPHSFVYKTQKKMFERLREASNAIRPSTTSVANTAPAKPSYSSSSSAAAALVSSTNPVAKPTTVKPITAKPVAPVVTHSTAHPTVAKQVSTQPVHVKRFHVATLPAPPPPKPAPASKTWVCTPCGHEENSVKQSCCVMCGSERAMESSAASTICGIASSASMEAQSFSEIALPTTDDLFGPDDPFASQPAHTEPPDSVGEADPGPIQHEEADESQLVDEEEASEQEPEPEQQVLEQQQEDEEDNDNDDDDEDDKVEV